MFVKLIDTLPALAVSEAVLYFSSPSGLASRLTADLAAVPPVEDEPEDDVLEVVAGVAGVEDELEVELLLEEPQPAISSAASMTLTMPGTNDRPRTVRAIDLPVGVARVIAFSPCRRCLGGSPPDHFTL
jgi:hypothetical protein